MDSNSPTASAPKERKRFNVPMALTWTRVALIPFVVGVFYIPFLSQHAQNVIACVIFCVAAITDALDGYIARKYDLTTPMGAFLDSVADKLLVCAAIIALLALDRVGMLVALIIVGREIAVTGLREWMGENGASSPHLRSGELVRKSEGDRPDGVDPAAPLVRPARAHQYRGNRFLAYLDRRDPDALFARDLHEGRDTVPLPG